MTSSGFVSPAHPRHFIRRDPVNILCMLVDPASRSAALKIINIGTVNKRVKGSFRLDRPLL